VITRPASSILILCAAASLASACARSGADHHSVTLENGAVKRTPAPAPTGPALASFERKIRLLSASVQPAEAAPGDSVTLTLRFEALETLFDDWRVFVHGQLQGAELTQLQDDHDPLDGKYPTGQWQRGDLVEEQRSLRLPPGLPGRNLQLFVGLYQGEQRLRVDDKANHDGQNRVPAAQLLLRGGVDLPEARALPAAGPIVVDGKLDEPGWASAQVLGPFVHYHGRGTPSNSTTARILYDDKNLYLGFDCADRDAWTSYSKRDDPIYNEEAVEIFVDVDGDLHTYVELQQSPANVHFDAAFAGRRQNMDTAYNAEYETALVVDGTLNDPADQDRGWVSEWRIPFDQIRGLQAPPKVGDAWRINLFRLDRVRQNGRVVDNQASAWSSPLSGDFHNIGRFGWLRFAAAPAPASQPQ
jgi:hypothetical protein